MQSNRSSKSLNIALRLVLAALFIFSGLAKGINPFGLSIQITEYLSAMGLDFFGPMAFLLAILLPAGEIFLGLMLAFGLLPRVTAWATGVVMAGFTGLTWWIYLTNPVNDCGCFGDVLKISNAATFYKNLVFLAIAILYIYSVMRFSGQRVVNWKKQVWKWGLAVVIALGVPLYSITTLPLIDGTEYKVGVNLVTMANENDHMNTPEMGADEMTLIYRNKKTGATQQFAVTDTTWYDTLAWEYVETIVKSGPANYTPTAKFMMLDPTGQDVSQTLTTQQPVLLLVSPQLQGITSVRVSEISKANPHLRVIVLTAAPTEELTASGLEAYGCDYSTLRAMIQHRKGGAILLRNGVIVQKWALSRLPQQISK